MSTKVNESMIKLHTHTHTHNYYRQVVVVLLYANFVRNVNRYKNLVKGVKFL